MMSIKDIWLSSPAIMSVLFFCSVLLAACALERWWCFRGRGRTDESHWLAVRKALVSRNTALAEQEARLGEGLLAAALTEIVGLLRTTPGISRDDVEDVWQLRREEAAEVLRRQLSVFGTLSFITPLIGLMGSVLGIHHAFHSIALSGIGGPSVIAAGVSEALLCTLVGVSVAVPSLIVNNVFSSAMVARLSVWDRVGQDLVRTLSLLSRDGAPPAASGSAAR